eukprot:3940285-Pleurochrysis_carterae.AAC.1
MSTCNRPCAPPQWRRESGARTVDRRAIAERERCQETRGVMCTFVRQPRAHTAETARIEGRIHNGACRLCTKIGESVAPRTAGCSRIYSAPASWAARRSRTVLNSTSNEFVRFVEFAGVAVRYIRQAHGVVAVSHLRRSTVVSGGRGEEAGNGECGARGRRKYGRVIASGATVQESLVHRVVEEVVRSAPPGVRVVVNGVGGVAEAGQERRDTVPSVYGTREEEERSPCASSCSGSWEQVTGAGETAISCRNVWLFDCK